jgi:hypothetical protein
LKGLCLDFSQFDVAVHNSKIVHSSDNFKRHVAAPQHVLRPLAASAAMQAIRSSPVKIAS